MLPLLYIIVPCYNEQDVLPLTSSLFLDELKLLISGKKVAPGSRILFVDDGSKDGTAEIITNLSKENEYFEGLFLSRNRGHQNALLAGLMEAMDLADITISIDCDGQDDISKMEEMVDAYADGCEIVYGVRSNRDSDTFFKRTSANAFYKLLKIMGVEIVYNHADYRLLSARALEALSQFKEVNLFLRGMIPLVGFKSTTVAYERKARIAGKSHYSIAKMFQLAFNGITSLSVKPIKLITNFGLIISLISFIGIIWAIIRFFTGHTIVGWTSMTCILCFFSGIQLISIGIIGEYIGKIYLETKGRPRYIISGRTYEEKGDNNV